MGMSRDLESESGDLKGESVLQSAAKLEPSATQGVTRGYEIVPTIDIPHGSRFRFLDLISIGGLENAMSELAFNLNGDPFDPPSNTIAWRVRRFKSKGAPEVVYGRQGIPLVLPIDATMEDLRREVRVAEGRYRLDALDEDNRPIAGAPPAYVCIHPDDLPAPAPGPTQVRNQLPPADHALIEAMRINSELARTVIERFPMILESSAVLLRAADNAGMPARPPRPYQLIVANDDEADDEANDEPAEPPHAKQGGVMGFVEMLLDKLAPEIVRAVLAGKLQVPGGLGALLDGRRAVAPTAAAEAHTTSAPDVGPAPGRRVPAPAASSRGPQPTHAAAPRVAGPEPRSSFGASGAPTAGAAPEGLPTIDEGDLSHFTAILDALSLQERMYARALVAELSASELRAWIAELKELPVSEAVTKIRAVLAGEPDDAIAAPSAGVGIPATTGGSP